MKICCPSTYWNGALHCCNKVTLSMRPLSMRTIKKKNTEQTRTIKTVLQSVHVSTDCHDVSHDLRLWPRPQGNNPVSASGRGGWKKIPSLNFSFTAELKSAGENFPISARRCSPPSSSAHWLTFTHMQRNSDALFSVRGPVCVRVCAFVCARPRSSDCVLHTPGSPQGFVNTVGETPPPPTIPNKPPRSALLIRRLHAHHSDTRTSCRRAHPNVSWHQHGPHTMHSLMRDAMGCLQWQGFFFFTFFQSFLATSPQDFLVWLTIVGPPAVSQNTLSQAAAMPSHASHHFF